MRAPIIVADVFPDAVPDVVAATQAWVRDVVVGLNLCPFARKELALDRVRFAVTAAKDEESLLFALLTELELLQRDSTVATTLLIHPDSLQDFDDYNQFLQLADELLHEQNLEGVYQIASFHPDYQFADTAVNAAENYTNRSPYPMLHIINEASLQTALETYPDAASIPNTNIALLKHMGQGKMEALLQACFSVSSETPANTSE